MKDTQENRESVGQALLEFTTWIKELGNKEMDTANMSDTDSEEDIRASVRKWIEIRKKRGFLYK